MRIVVTGASGNVGTEILSLLTADPRVTAVAGIARRPPADTGRVEWVALDIGGPVAAERLTEVFRGADAVIHLAWLIQPSHRVDVMARANLDGTAAVLRALVAAGVPAIVHASSVGAYSPGPKHSPVLESWPTGGISTSPYSRHKVAAERMLDELEAAQPQLRVVRLRPGLMLQRDAGSAISRYFLGPLVPLPLIRRALLPVVPAPAGLRVQALSTSDAARAFVRCALEPDARGAFNLAAAPVLDRESVAEAIGGRALPLPGWLLRAAVSVSWQLHLHPTDPGWIDLAMGVPLLDTSRAERELGWRPQVDARAALLDLLDGLATRAGRPTAALRPAPWSGRRIVEAVRGRNGRS
ncbi:MAG: NAD-dependent epimerase/dehydratase family protein [Actinomycetota bacterium]|nr:NAD-dependent epimerase/dehydratase family protein [Actinomycetota bacterium]